MKTSRGNHRARAPHQPYRSALLAGHPLSGYGPARPPRLPGRTAGTAGTGHRAPPRAGETRRYLAVGLDCYLCLVTAGLLARPHVGTAPLSGDVALLLGPVLALSFLNQVVLTALVGAGAGKLIMGIRVVSLPDGGRPGPGQLVRRWLHGLCWLPLQPWYGLRARLARTDDGHGAAPRGCEEGDPYAEPYADPAGVRQVRRSDLAAHRRAAAGRAA